MTIENNRDIIKELEELHLQSLENSEKICILVSEFHRGKEIRVVNLPGDDFFIDDNFNKYDKYVLIGEEVMDCLLSEAKKTSGDSTIKSINSYNGIPVIRISNAIALMLAYWMCNKGVKNDSRG